MMIRHTYIRICYIFCFKKSKKHIKHYIANLGKNIDLHFEMGHYRTQISATIFMILKDVKILVGTKHVGWFCGKRKLSFWLLLGEMHVPCWHGNAFSNWESSKMLPSPALNNNTCYYIILRLNHTVYILNFS